MATELLEPADVDLSATRRSLLLVWQSPVSRLFTKVGQLDALVHGRFAFRYFASAWDDPDFQPLIEFPERDRIYVSDELPAFFANRILSEERTGYGRYLEWLGIDALGPEDVPLEVLTRTGGGRATDTFHIVDLPRQSPDRFSSRFFVSGIRYTDNVADVLANVENEGLLKLQLEEGNETNPKAVLIDSSDGRKIGYVPDWLCGEIHALIKHGWTMTAVAERINRDAPAHVRVLCRIDARRD